MGDAPRAQPRPPGPVVGTLLAGAVLLAWLAAQLLGAAAIVGAQHLLTGNEIDALTAHLERNPDLLCLLSAFAGIVAFLFLRALPAGGEWRFARRPFLVGVALTLGFHLAAGLLSQVVGRPEAPEVVLDLFEGASALSFALAVVVVAPLWEEALFRGLLFNAWRETRLGAGLAVVVSAASWAAIHVEYDLFDVGTLFVYGLVLGALRARTGSLGLVVALHALFNVVAFIELLLITA